MAWELDGKRSIYQQLIEIIRQRIITGVYAPGARLDSVRDLANEAGVNPNTMQRALAELENSGIIYSVRTSGRFVTDDQEMIRKLREEEAQAEAAAFLGRMRSLGFTGDEVLEVLKKMEG
jgi:DNA-binding transcriptional regulator YhcF (GntR family)